MASCSVNFHSSLEFGQTLFIGGTTSRNSSNFKITLTTVGEDEIALKIFVNLWKKKISLSSFLDSRWDESSDSSLDAMKAGEPFKISIFVGDGKFHVAYNGEHLNVYDFKTSLTRIQDVRVSGDLEKITQVDHRSCYPTAWPPIQQDLETIGFSSDVPHKFKPGSVIVLRMIVTGSTDGSWFIRFNEFGTKKQLFHFNPRFAERLIIVNCMSDSLL